MSMGTIRVVMFGGGPVLEPDVKRFLARLEDDPQIELCAAFCQSAEQSGGAVLRDLFRRRGILALPVLALQLLGRLRRALSEGARQRKVEQTIAALGQRLNFVPDVHIAGVLEQVRSLQPELGLVYGAPILRPELFEIPTLGTLGIHHGKMPTYRGKKTTFWAMANGEESAGVTIQKINRGLDTGQIVQQGEVPIARRSHGRVWRDVEELGLTLYLAAIHDFAADRVAYLTPTGRKGKLYRDPKPKDILGFYWRRWTGRI